MAINACDKDLGRASKMLDMEIDEIKEIALNDEYLVTLEDSEKVRDNVERSIQGKDPLTNLPNRLAFLTELEYLSKNSPKISIMFIDLNRFKELNDSEGHKAGDVALCTIAERLEANYGHQAVVTRLGGDEFFAVPRFGFNV